MWGHLEDAVREGTNRWKQTFGWDGPIFSHFFRTEGAMREFQQGMHGFGRLSSPAVVAAFDLSRSFGGWWISVEEPATWLKPRARGIRISKPPCSICPEWLRCIPEPSPAISSPIRCPRRILYSLGRILHDWSEEKIVKLLAKIHAALPAGGGLLIAEKLLEPDYVSGHMQSLNMLIVTEGRERSASEYEALLAAAGFSKVESRRTGAPLDAILAIK